MMTIPLTITFNIFDIWDPAYTYKHQTFTQRSSMKAKYDKYSLIIWHWKIDNSFETGMIGKTKNLTSPLKYEMKYQRCKLTTIKVNNNEILLKYEAQ